MCHFAGKKKEKIKEKQIPPSKYRLKFQIKEGYTIILLFLAFYRDGWLGFACLNHGLHGSKDYTDFYFLLWLGSSVVMGRRSAVGGAFFSFFR
jgi:hypothetical protein